MVYIAGIFFYPLCCATFTSIYLYFLLDKLSGIIILLYFELNKKLINRVDNYTSTYNGIYYFDNGFHKFML